MNSRTNVTNPKYTGGEKVHCPSGMRCAVTMWSGTWGTSDPSANGVPVAVTSPDDNPVVLLETTDYATAALHADGRVSAWGYPASCANAPSAVTALSNGTQPVVGLAASSGAFAALHADGAVTSWGDTANKPAPASVTQPSSPVTSVASAGNRAFAAIHQDGSVSAWGNDFASAGYALSHSSPVIELFSTRSTFAALHADGHVSTFGQQNHLALSAPSSVTSPSVPVVSIAAHEDAYAALHSDVCAS